MAAWAKVKFFWETMLGSAFSTLTASTTAPGNFSVDNIHNMLETNMWMAGQPDGPHYISYDAGPGYLKQADYLAVIGHNLNTTGASVTLQYCSDGINYSDALVPFSPGTDKAFLREFANPGAYRFWRLRIIGTSAAPYLTICVWGRKTELDYATASFDPYEEERKASVNLSYGGYLAGSHTHYTERSVALRFDDADGLMYGKVREWWEGNGLRNFFLAWESANNPEDIFLMRPDIRFSNPLKAGGAARDITIGLTGRKE